MAKEFKDEVESFKRSPKKVISLRVDIKVEDKFHALCEKHEVVKADIYSWALAQAVKKMEEEYE